MRPYIDWRNKSTELYRAYIDLHAIKFMEFPKLRKINES